MALLKEDATAVMPPWLQWFIGREVIGHILCCGMEDVQKCSFARIPGPQPTGSRLLPFMSFPRRKTLGIADSIHVLTLENDLISGITLFLEPRLIHDFGLPQFLPQDADSGSRNHGAQVNMELCAVMPAGA